MVRIIVVDDDPTACKVLRRMLRPTYQVETFADGATALAHFMEAGAEIILTDLRMPEMDGFELLGRAKAVDPEVIVFIITGFSTVDSAVTAIKKGAHDYIPKPFEPDDVLLRIERALKERRLEEGMRLCQQERRRATEQYDLVTNHPAMHAMLAMTKKVARTDSTVLIQGETGVGKELVARLIHRWSPRREHAFVPINCSALSEGIIESELFGHEKGAFTGAGEQRVGFFELAHRGTILLDEIGTTDHRFQVKLLRVLQDRSIYRVGSPKARRIDVRVVAATNQDLEDDVREGRFRSDLYYRLSVVTIRIPPLRERRGDIPLLAEHFIRKYRQINPCVSGVSPAGLRLLMEYDYPGNVRELENIIERAMILESSDLLQPASLLLDTGRPHLLGSERTDGGRGEPKGAPLTLEQAERRCIQQALALTGGKKVEAARMLGINKTTLWRKMKRYGMFGEPEAAE